MNKKPASLSSWQIFTIILAFAFVIATCILTFFYIGDVSKETDLTILSAVLSTLFTGLAFAGLISTILMQRNELKLQREELAATRDEFTQQNSTLKQQRFENTFFNMLNVHHQIVASIPTGLVTGRLALNDIAKKNLLPFVTLSSLTDSPKLPDSDEEKSVMADMLAERYKKSFYNDHEHIFNHYFRNLYHIYKYIYFSDLTVDEKDFYGSLVGAQLSQYEFILIALNGLLEGYGKPKFLYLMREFNILRNFRSDQITEPLVWPLIVFRVNNAQYPFERDKPNARKIS